MLRQTRPPVGLQLEVPAHPDSVGLARDAVRGSISAPDPVLEAVTIVVSELVTNAVRHAGLGEEDMVLLELSSLEDCVRVQVTDRGPGFDRSTVQLQEPTAAGGFGLRIVASLSRGWGVRVNAGVVWADIPR